MAFFTTDSSRLGAPSGLQPSQASGLGAHSFKNEVRQVQTKIKVLNRIHGAGDQATKREFIKASGTAQAAVATDEGASKTSGELQAPRPKKISNTLPALFNDVREDPYQWLRDDSRKDSEILDHINAENKYTASVMSDTLPLQEELYKEMRGKIKEADTTVPLRQGPYYYYSRTEEGKQYQVHCRRSIPGGAGPAGVDDQMDTGSEGEPEEILLDENEEATKSEFYKVGGFEVSPDHKLLAFGEDTEGGERYTLRVRDIATAKDVGTRVPKTSVDLAWANDNKTLFYVSRDEIERPYKVWRHKLNADAEKDVCVFEEKDPAFFVYLERSASEEYLFVMSKSSVTSDVRVLRTDDPDGEFVAVTPRNQGVDTAIDHRGGHFFVTQRSDEFRNSQILVCSVEDPSATSVLVPHRPDVKVEAVWAFENHLAIFERENGLQTIATHRLPPPGEPITKLEDAGHQRISIPEESYTLQGAPGQFHSPVIRFLYSSQKTPPTVVDYDMSTGLRAEKKVQPVLGGFNAEHYEAVRRWAMAPDGVKVPISIMYRSGVAKLDGTDPMLLDGYGAYENMNGPLFSANLLSLVDRGFVIASAHVRGGGEMGRPWYEDGRLLKKKNSFTDFVACAEFLLAEKFASREKLCIVGRSAGGLLMGAVLNLRPDLFHAAIAGVPFVDVLTTMLDASIPLTTIEYEEWGNPNEEKYYKYIKSYSPIDNVEAKDYPNLLVTAGLYDPRVAYWEPLKWVAKLRELKTSRNLLMLKCDLGAGHYSKSGRFDKLKEVAFEYAFLLKSVNMIDSKTVN